MTLNQENERATSGNNLLTPQEQAICEQIATREAPHSQRAMALLALNERSTQARAAEQAGLSTGQVKYWIAKFRKQRLGVFPDTVLDELDAEAKVELVTEIEKEPAAVTKKADSVKDKTKEGKKEKKAKKKTRKAKKDKKGKKARKSKKKTGKAKKDRKSKKAKKSKM